eukprot:14125275-Alexandrium_andersonii.AAC.1
MARWTLRPPVGARPSPSSGASGCGALRPLTLSWAARPLRASGQRRMSTWPSTRASCVATA